jgi:hypothetical protein
LRKETKTMAMLTEKKQKEDGRRADQQQRQSIGKQHGEDLPFSSFCFFSRSSHVFPWPQKSEIEQSHPGNFGILLRIVDAVATATAATAAAAEAPVDAATPTSTRDDREEVNGDETMKISPHDRNRFHRNPPPAAPRPPIPPSDDDDDRRKRMGKALLAYHQSSSSSLSSSILRD